MILDLRRISNFFWPDLQDVEKHFFVADLLQNLDTITKDSPSFIIYVYKTWQWKFDEMKHLVHVFLEDDENVVEKIKEYATGKSIFSCIR